MRVYIAVIMIILAACSFALADYHYVSHDGSNEYPYTSWATAADSINFAVSAASAGDTIFIGAGEWLERVFLNLPDTNLAFIGAGTDSTLWWWDVLGSIVLITRKGTYLQNIHFDHPRTCCIDATVGDTTIIEDCLFTGGTGAIITASYNYLRVQNCVFDSVSFAVRSTTAEKVEIYNCLIDKVRTRAFGLDPCDTAIIENNILIDILGFGVYLSNIHDSSLVRNNLIYNRGDPDEGYCDNCRVVINNTFDNFVWSMDYHAAIINFLQHDFVFKNNSFSRLHNGFYFFNYSGYTVPASYLNFWDVDYFGLSDGPSVVWDTVAIQWEYPMFVGDGDYHLQEFSPLIDAGDPDILDVDSSRSDIGVFGGPGGSTYSYLDLAPLIPDSLTAMVIADTIFIDWRDNYETDFNRYQLHRETYSGFVPSVLNMISEPLTSSYVDTDLTPGYNYYYRISAIDNQDNISDYSVELEVITTGINGGWGAEMPTITVIESNYPNPFNAQTTLVYTVANLGPIPAQINIDIYDIMGRRVRTLLDDRMGVGQHRIIWDGRTDDGSDCPSGIYFAKIRQWKVDYLDRHRKIVLLR